MTHELPSSPKTPEELRAKLVEMDAQFIELGEKIMNLNKRLVYLKQSNRENYPEFKQLEDQLADFTRQKHEVNRGIIALQKEVYKTP